ncbi:hypothetical protein AUP68_13485 [Ilyonectria robusta]
MLSILRKARLKDKEMRILMLYVAVGLEVWDRRLTKDSGLDNAGKTTIVKKIMGEDVNTRRAARIAARRGLCQYGDATGQIWQCMANQYAMQRLAGASLLVFANKTDVDGCMTEQEILAVSCRQERTSRTRLMTDFGCLVPATGVNTDTPLAHFAMQCHDGQQSQGGIGVGGGRRQEATVPLLNGVATQQIESTYPFC